MYILTGFFSSSGCAGYKVTKLGGWNQSEPGDVLFQYPLLNQPEQRSEIHNLSTDLSYYTLRGSSRSTDYYKTVFKVPGNAIM